MEPPPSKRSKRGSEPPKLWTDTGAVSALAHAKEKERPAIPAASTTPLRDLPAHHVHTVRQQLHDLLSKASAVRCGTALPMELSDKIIDYCLYRDFSELPSGLFREGEHEVIQGLEESDDQNSILADPLRQDQLAAIESITDNTFIWGMVPEKDIEIWWAHVGFPVGWKGSGEMLEFDLWMCCEGHWQGVFVFESGRTEVLLRDDPAEFCRAVRNPHRAVELSKLSADILWLILANQPCDIEPW